jgi:RNA polymerase sigma-70 factor (ECF subfamily)
MQYPENELWQQIQQGSLQAYEKLFHKLYAPLCGYANQYLSDPDEAENLVQELFCYLWENKDSLEISTGIKPYLYKSAFHRSLNIIKRSKRMEPILTEEGEYKPAVLQQTSLHEQASTNELQEQYQQALSDMPEGRRTIFQLSRQDELTYREIAELLDISIKTVETQMSKALGFLRVRLSDFLVLFLIIQYFTQFNHTLS